MLNEKQEGQDLPMYILFPAKIEADTIDVELLVYHMLKVDFSYL